jgi:hypothetical protein
MYVVHCCGLVQAKLTSDVFSQGITVSSWMQAHL